MTWVRLDDGFTDHPKVAALSDAAFRAFVTALCYCNKNLTDGLVPALISKQITTRKSLAELLAVGMFERDGSNYRVHDYDQYQPSRESVISQRSATRERVSNWRGNRASNALGNSVTSHIGNGVSNTAPVPDPVPDPIETHQPKRKVVDFKAGQESAIRHRLWDVYAQLTMRPLPSVQDERQFELWEENGVTIEQIDGALSDTVAEQPQHPWAWFRTVLGRRIVTSKVPKPKPVETLTAEQVRALREQAATR